MKHTSNLELFKYWNKLRGARLAPDRSEIDPGEIRKVLGDTFVFEADGHGNFPLRIAGTRLCALFGRELKGESFVNLWHQSGQSTVRELIGAVMEEKVVCRSYRHDHSSLLRRQSRNDDAAGLAIHPTRVLGALAPMGALIGWGQGIGITARHVPAWSGD
jgi:hypothetical protein